MFVCRYAHLYNLKKSYSELASCELDGIDFTHQQQRNVLELAKPDL
jgi:hypothetical protein